MFYINSSDNVKIAVYDYNTESEKTIFLVHGWPLSHKIYEYQIDNLIECGYRVIAIDLRGFGNSDTPACGYSYDQMAKDIYCVIRFLNITCFTLVGFSMGGSIALRYMKNYDGFGVTKLILLAAAAPSWTQREGFPYGFTCSYVNDLICQISKDRPQFAYDFTHNQLFACTHSESVKSWFEDIALSASGIGTVQTAFSLRDEDGWEDLCAVHVPTIIIHGAKDTVVPNDVVRIQHNSISGSILHTLENSGHGIMYDELEKFNCIFFSSLNS